MLCLKNHCLKLLVHRSVVERLKAIWFILCYGMYYHVEIMEPNVHPVHHRFVSTTIFQTQELNTALDVAEYYENAGHRVRAFALAGYRWP